MAESCAVELPSHQNFIPYEKMSQNTVTWHSKKLDNIKKWVAMEKIHGANFSFTVVCTQTSDLQLETDKTDANPPLTVMVARRGDYLKEGEQFFGVETQREFLEGEKEKARRVCAAVRQRMDGDSTQLQYVTIFGELFGGLY